MIPVPLIPGVTDTDKNLSDIALTVKELPSLVGVELLPYNRAAGGKYSLVKMRYRPGFDEFQELNINTDIFQNNGLEVKAV